MQSEDILPLVQAVVFLVLGVMAFATWLRQRPNRSAAYLALSFAVIAVVVLIGRFEPDEGSLLARTLSWSSVTLLAGFPWLFVAFAWSFGGRLPPSVRLLVIPVAALSVWAAVSPLSDAGEGTPAWYAFVASFLLVWTGLTLLAAARLWRSGDGSPSVRSRTRLMAVGALVLNLVLVSAAFAPPSMAAQLVTLVLSGGAALLFLAGFAPPRWLRSWWRSRTTAAYQQMLSALIVARTLPEIGAAVAPMVADLVGAGTAVVDGDGHVIARARLDANVPADVDRFDLQRAGDDGFEVFPAGEVTLLLASTPYTPVFGAEERGLVAALAIELRFAVERARTFEALAEAQATSERAQRELEATVYGLAHDLRTPAVAITGFSELLIDSHDPADREEMVGHIRSSADYINGLVDSLLDLSRVGRTQTEPQAVDLGRLVQRVAARLHQQCPGLEVVADQLPVLSLNPVRAEQLLENLLANACKHAGRDDVRVEISCRAGAGEVQLVVADNGRGVSEQDRDGLFELFRRGSHGHPGSGIGLGMVRRIAESYDGSVELADEGVGATFVVRFPATLQVA